MGRMKDLAIRLEEARGEMEESDEKYQQLEDADERYQSLVEDSIIALHEEIAAIAKKTIGGNSPFYAGRPRKVWSSIASQAMHEVSVAEEVNK